MTGIGTLFVDHADLPQDFVQSHSAFSGRHAYAEPVTPKRYEAPTTKTARARFLTESMHASGPGRMHHRILTAGARVQGGLK